MHFGEEAVERVLVYEDENFSNCNLERPQPRRNVALLLGPPRRVRRVF